ncbi:50S ribosomal protein L11 methyltransferase [Pseudanabaena mucicola]|uniref:50S ribosomal protein L11 methyltransferase n=1 Tax=Pseudanabaena mucicola FACHB-723 TaxID=2692860 RepID=A0ABR7ZUU6_9CYAN|nr:50S ribosomal protein L11 methyltransferase [Pseudanabaena mucicola]MBD2187504.1 50S ribosomal protein L11 methyltransferase [Pseudanabaena mucicola FACHB-723]
MAWIELSLDTTNEAVDWVCTLLANAIAVEDMRIGNHEDRHGKWTFTIQMYLPKDSQIHQRIDAIANILKPLHRTGMTSELQTFVIDQKPMASGLNADNAMIRRIGRFVILANDAHYGTNDDQKNDPEIILRLQNSLAFGSGLHPATILSLQLLERHVKPDLYALDLGSGSGVLSVAMAKMGATVLAIDNDPIAVTATAEAVELNQVIDKVTTMCGSLGSASQLGHWMGGDGVGAVPAIDADQKFDLIVANIFARVHISLADEFYRALRISPNSGASSGTLITAGYTSDRAENVTDAMVAAGFSVSDRAQIDEWIAIAFHIL